MSVAGRYLPAGHDANSNRKGIDCHGVRRSPDTPGKYKNPRHARIGDSPQRTVLPWEAFLPSTHEPGANGRQDLHRQHTSKNNDFKELLNEGKKRLEKAGQEQQLRERADVVGSMGGCELEALLADLCEPSFSRRQNE